MNGKKGKELFEGLVRFLANHGIDIQNCCGQSYDNVSVMSGRYNDLQAKVAVGAGNSLNLV